MELTAASPSLSARFTLRIQQAPIIVQYLSAPCAFSSSLLFAFTCFGLKALPGRYDFCHASFATFSTTEKHVFSYSSCSLLTAIIAIDYKRSSEMPLALNGLEHQATRASNSDYRLTSSRGEPLKRVCFSDSNVLMIFSMIAKIHKGVLAYARICRKCQ